MCEEHGICSVALARCLSRATNICRRRPELRLIRLWLDRSLLGSCTPCYCSAITRLPSYIACPRPTIICDLMFELVHHSDLERQLSTPTLAEAVSPALQPS